MSDLKSIVNKIIRKFNPSFSTITYWETRYQAGGNSGSGSYKHLAEFKAGFLNKFLVTHPVASVIEFGCGDGNQLSLVGYPKYTGLDVAATSIKLCSEKFSKDSSKDFLLYDPFSFSTNNFPVAELSLSIDVIFHLVEDDIYELYMKHLFQSASRFVIVYSSDYENKQVNHERRRKFTKWIALNRPDWKLIEHTENPFLNEADPEAQSFSDFYVFSKT
jgi:hypothetical protein